MEIAQDINGIGGATAREQFSSSRPRGEADTANCPALLKVALLTGGQDRHYAVGFAMALMDQNIYLDIIGSDDIDGPEFQHDPRARIYNLHGSQEAASLLRRTTRILAFYLRLLRYATSAKPKIFHILWNNRLQVYTDTLM